MVGTKFQNSLILKTTGAIKSLQPSNERPSPPQTWIFTELSRGDTLFEGKTQENPEYISVFYKKFRQFICKKGYILWRKRVHFNKKICTQGSVFTGSCLYYGSGRPSWAREACEISTTHYAGARWLLYKEITFTFIIEVSKPLLKKGKVISMAKKANSLAHTKWMCKYHIVLPIVISITQGFTSIPKARSWFTWPLITKATKAVLHRANIWGITGHSRASLQENWQKR